MREIYIEYNYDDNVGYDDDNSMNDENNGILGTYIYVYMYV
jgi:hypothetical protein